MNIHLRSLFRNFSWSAGRDYILITLGILLQAFAIRLFLVPGHLVNGGISGLAQIINFDTDGPNVVRTAIIITSNPERMSLSVLTDLERGVTSIDATGVYTRSKRSMLYCVINRSEVSELKSLVLDADPDALIVIGQAHEALDERFRSLRQCTGKPQILSVPGLMVMVKY
jgi:uncharacterized membrane-anchored protein YitT (DUF2179 family)